MFETFTGSSWHDSNKKPSCVREVRVKHFLTYLLFVDLTFMMLVVYYTRYFNHLMHVFIDEVLNWDQVKGCSKPGVGLFGRTTGFFAATESQNSTGDLHSHMLIWIDGMPRTVAKYYEACKSSGFRDLIAESISSIAKATYPISDNRCPRCGLREI